MLLELLCAGVVGGLIARGGSRPTECRTVYTQAPRDPNYGVARISQWIPSRRRTPFCDHDMEPCTQQCRKCNKSYKELIMLGHNHLPGI